MENGNWTTATVKQTYRLVNGQAKVATSQNLTHTKNADGGESWQDGTVHNGIQTAASMVTYDYDLTTGKLKGNGANATDGKMASVENGNWTDATVKQVYRIVNGQAKVLTSQNLTHTVNVDGSESWQDGLAHNGIQTVASLLTLQFQSNTPPN